MFVEIILLNKKKHGGPVEFTEETFKVLLDIIKKFPDYVCLKVVDDVFGFRIVKEERKAPRIERAQQVVVPPKKVLK